jgi:hypothetical protein
MLNKIMETKKWFYHCPICKQFVLKGNNRLITENRNNNSIQYWHKNCLKKELSK